MTARTCIHQKDNVPLSSLKPTALFCFARGKQNVNPLNFRRGFLLLTCASRRAWARESGFGVRFLPLQLTHSVAQVLFVLDKAFLFFLDFVRCQLCTMYHPEYTLYPMSNLNRGNKAVIWFSHLQREPDLPRAPQRDVAGQVIRLLWVRAAHKGTNCSLKKKKEKQKNPNTTTKQNSARPNFCAVLESVSSSSPAQPHT